MHLQQTKAASRLSGGPQYYFHNLPDHVKEFLRKRKACPVVLQTPYGIATTSFVAVDRDHKISPSGKPVPGRVGHDRIQAAGRSIGEEIRYWHDMESKDDFERVDLECEIHPDGHFILIPIGVQMRGKRHKKLEKISSPLSFHRDYQSKFWRTQIEACRRRDKDQFAWACAQLTRIVADHREQKTQNVHEADLLRSAGALSVFGLTVGLYRCKGYDCPTSSFHFQDLPVYKCPIEIKKRSSGFKYQILRYFDLPRVVVLCVDHDLVNPPNHVDIVELSAMAKFFGA